MMKGCIFDLDGTLIDSIELIVRCFQHTTKTHLGISMPEVDVLALIGKPLRPELERMAPGRGLELTATYREMQFGLHDQLVKPFSGIPELIIDLTNRGFAVGIATSKAQAGTQKALELFGETAQHFKTVITIDDCENHKPHPEPLLMAAKNLGVKPEHSLYIGDSIFDMEAAVAANMTPVGVTWGAAKEDALRAYTPHVFHRIDALFNFITATDR